MNSENSIDLAWMEPIIAKYRGHGRDSLLPLLHDTQEIYGWLPREVQQAVGETLRVPLAEIHGVIEFYSMFYNEPTPKKVIRVCEDPACLVRGGGEVIDQLADTIEQKSREASSASAIAVERVPCLGLCDQGPAVLAADKQAGKVKRDDVPNLLEGELPPLKEQVYGSHRVITERIGLNNTQSIQDYIQDGGFELLHQSLRKNPERIIEEIEACGILGRGGAMFPLGRKWRFTREARGREIEKFIVVNGDESEPGTFKDRYLMEGDPFALIEAAAIAGYTVGANKGWIFVRGEYPRAYQILKNAAAECYEKGFLGSNILESGFDFDIELRLGAGAYICGEETALFSAIEGYRGFPRIKPPFPVTHGLFNKPTVVNNVETLITALKAMKLGSEEWLKLGTEQSPGTKLFCVSGTVKRPGLYELPFGATVQEIIDLSGGVLIGDQARAVLLGGAAGTFIGPDDFDLPLTYEDARSRNVSLGSGVVMVFDESVDLREIFVQLGRFFAHESCGKCFPCQLGTKRQVEILERINSGMANGPSSRRDLVDIGFAMTETSLCGLGQTAGLAVLSAVKLWPELFE